MPESAKKTKVYLNGVEYIPSLCFTSWKPGFEYSKNLSFKNLNTKSVKITYELPKTRFFSTLFPKVISLSPGTTFVLPVTFRPLDKIQYEDYIEVNQIEFGKIFKIPLTAELPQFKLEFENELTIGSCAVNEIISKKIKINNLSELDTLFEWDIKEPFTVSLVSGEIKAHSTLEVTFNFQPTEALNYKCRAICKYGNNPLNMTNCFKIIELNGIGKYPHLLLENDNFVSSEITLNFGRLLLGQSCTKFITIMNMTEVATNYFIERCTDIPVFDACFNCAQLQGTLQPREKQKIPITYTPNTSYEDEIHDYFNVYSSGKLTKNVINCVALNISPKVMMDKDMINFGLCYMGDRVAQTFQLTNYLSLSVAFQFDIDCDYSCFKFSETNGVLQPNESRLIQVYFVPQHPIIYYKKISCLVQNHDVIYIEMLGTSHLELMKPPIVNKKHLELYYYLKYENLLNNSPEQLMELHSSGKIKITDELVSAKYLEIKDQLAKTGTEDYINDSYHYPDIRREPQITLDQYYLDFGACKSDPNDEEFNEQKTVTLFNKTKGKMLIFWNETAENQTFIISPNKCEIPPMKNYSFRVKFLPKTFDQFYGAKLEGYAIYKSLCDFTIAEPKFITVSSCLNIDCLGHTFHPNNETFFTPRYLVDSDNIIFPSTVKDRAVYRTFTLKNLAPSVPLTFNFETINNNEWYVKPHKGFIRNNQSQIFLFKFVPKTESFLVEKCEIMLNYLPSKILEVPLVGAGQSAKLELEKNGVLYFSPTCKYSTAYQSYKIKNLTRNKLVYEWRIPYESKNLFTVDEMKSEIKPYEIKECVWRFTPTKMEKYNHKVVLTSWIDGAKATTLKVYYLRLLGMCTSGLLQVAEMYKDFGNIIVGSSISSEITILNNNDCHLEFELFVKQAVDESVANSSVGSDFCILELEKMIGQVEARSKLAIRCRLRPTRLINYQFTVEYRIIYPNEKLHDSNDANTPKDHREILCHLTANGVYPKLRINDIKTLGAAASLSKDFFWKLLSINQLNSSMSCEPNADELIYSIATRQEANRRLASQFTKPMVEMNFSAAPLNSNDSQIILFVENIGLVPTDWVLLFPKDLLIELEYWAQTGEYDMEELEEMKIQDNKLFDIEPKKGHLEPSEIGQIKITYKHLFAGQSKLPILMKIAKGREILLNLTGTTVSNNEALINFSSNSFEFEPVEIGLSEYPIQIYEIYNGSGAACDLEIDTSALNELNYENYNQTVLECLSPQKLTIQPGILFETKWRFSPVEAKTYNVDITFKVNGSQINVITFKCIGYDKRKLNNMTVTSKMLEIPQVQSVLLPNQLASLSVDRIILGDIPLFTRERKLAFVKNNSSHTKITFTWHVTNPDHVKIIRNTEFYRKLRFISAMPSKYIRIQPSRGEIECNQSKLCKLTFLSKDRPSFYNIDLICEIKNQNEMNVYYKELEEWQREQKRQYEEFLIDENELETRLKSSIRVPELKENKLSEKQRVSQLSMQRFKTIPPIVKNYVVGETNLEKVRRIREEKKIWKKPAPPTPYLLHLNVLARTQNADEFLMSKNAIKNESDKFVDVMLGQLDATSADRTENSIDLESIIKIDCSSQERDVCSYVMSDLIRNLISDKSFHDLILKLKSEPIPYFIQFTGSGVINENDSLESQSLQSNRKKNDKNTQEIKASPLFGSLIESIFENTISNILTEAFNKEFSLTSRPRLIALPPKLGGSNGYTQSSSFVMNSYNKNKSEKSKMDSINAPAYESRSRSPTLSIKSVDVN